MAKFRDQKSLAKKIARSLGRGEVSDASRLEKNHAPKLTLDHVIKERYPTFIDALRDLDDALSLLFLFANLPSSSHVPPKTIALCQRVTHEFQHYLIATNSLRKSFLSIKGIYYQATIQGQDIMWLVPYRFVQRVNGDVDYRIMATFVEFYTTLLGFVNYRLYSSLGLRYPPKFDTRSDENGAELAAFTLEGRSVGNVPKAIEGNNTKTNALSNKVSSEVQSKVDKVIQDAGLDQTKDEKTVETTTEESNDAIDKFEPAAPEADTLDQPDLSAADSGSLFAPFTVYISREAPKAPLEFILRAFGCTRVGWDAVSGDGAFTHDETDTRITHQIVDRPPLPEGALPAAPAAKDGDVPQVKPGTRIPGRTYVQPQWIWDSINEGKLLRPDLYAPGTTLPPHLSPWVKPSRAGYDPKASLAAQEEEGEADLAEEESGSDEEMADDKADDKVDEKKNGDAKVAEASDEEDDSEDSEEEDGGMDVDLANSDEDEEEDDSESADEDFGGFEDDAASESEDDEEAARTRHQKELEAEAAGLPFSSANGGADEKAKKKSSQAKKIAAKKRKEEEELERQKMMMSRKKRKLLEKMMYSNKKQSDEAAKLRSKRRKLEKGEKGEKGEK